MILSAEGWFKGASVLRNGDLEHGTVVKGASVLRRGDLEHGRMV